MRKAKFTTEELVNFVAKTKEEIDNPIFLLDTSTGVIYGWDKDYVESLEDFPPFTIEVDELGDAV